MSKTIELSYVFTFGKFKGRSVEDLLASRERNYVAWCADNLSWFKLSEATGEALLAAPPSRRLRRGRFVEADDDDSDDEWGGMSYGDFGDN